ncbi:MAG: flagellar hook-basal body complex protein FliE [Desulfovibrionaceae bacterium]
MLVQNVALSAYKTALQHKQALDRQITGQTRTEQPQGKSFADAVKDSLSEINDMQNEKNQMITEFAAGKTDNIHELMIAMQKASVAMSMTTAVRSKVLSAYQEIMRMSI